MTAEARNGRKETALSAAPLPFTDPPVGDAKLRKIISALMEQVEKGVDSQGSAFSLFQTAILLEDKIRERTQTLSAALQELEAVNRKLTAAKADLEAAQERLREAIESISEGFIQCDADDRVVLFNTKFLELWPGIDRIAAPGIRFEDLSRWTVDQGLVAVADQRPQDWLKERLRCHRAPADPLVVRLTTGRWLQIRERRSRDGGTVGIYADITELKQREESRRQQELAEKSVLLQATLDNLAQGVSVFDKDLRLVAWNDRFVDLLDLPDWLVQPGASFADYLRFRAERGDYLHEGETAVAVRMELVRQGRSLHMEQTLADGTVLEVRRDPMPLGGFVTTHTDITDRKQAAELLREAKATLERRVAERTGELTAVNGMLREEIRERARIEEALRQAKVEAEEANLSKTRFLAAASHDLLQPLNAARLFVTALSDRDLGEKEREFVGRTDRALRSVEGLLGTLLDISKFDAGAVPIEATDFAIGDLLLALEQEYGPLAQESGLRFKVAPTRLVIRSDPALLGRILRNFVSNALRYTTSGGILLGCRRRGNHVRIETWDTGIGIPPANTHEIFQEFRQLSNPAAGKGKGFGLGLAIVQRIAKALGHPIQVFSAPGKGSVFAVEVPLGSAKGAMSDRVPSPRPPSDTIANAFVVVIENDDGVLVGMREVLNGWGCDVLACADGASALEAVAGSGRRPDIIIADYHLDDGSDGLGAIADLCAGCDGPIPAMIITADRNPEVLARVRRQGLHLLKKPVRPAKLRALMSHLIASGRAPGPPMPEAAVSPSRNRRRGQPEPLAFGYGP